MILDVTSCTTFIIQTGVLNPVHRLPIRGVQYFVGLKIYIFGNTAIIMNHVSTYRYSCTNDVNTYTYIIENGIVFFDINCLVEDIQMDGNGLLIQPHDILTANGIECNFKQSPSMNCLFARPFHDWLLIDGQLVNNDMVLRHKLGVGDMFILSEGFIV